MRPARRKALSPRGIPEAIIRTLLNCTDAPNGRSLRPAQFMKMLFSATDRGEVKLVRKKLFEAGIRCEVRQNPVAQGVFGVPSCPELWVNDDGDILKALRLLGTRRLNQMTVIFSGR